MDGQIQDSPDPMAGLHPARLMDLAPDSDPDPSHSWCLANRSETSGRDVMESESSNSFQHPKSYRFFFKHWIQIFRKFKQKSFQSWKV